MLRTRLSTISDASAAKIIPPCIVLLGTIGTALTFAGINPFWEKAIQGGVPIVPSKKIPISVPIKVPRPPVIIVPPTTTAAMAFISKPIPELLGIELNRIAFSKAASAVKAPINANTENMTRGGLMPANSDSFAMSG